MRHVLILAGGSGTRLWPYSTASRPKQLVPLFDGRSLLDVALERATATVPGEQVWLGVGGDLAALIPDAFDRARLVVEPSGRDTLPAIALGCATIAATDPDAVVAVLTADHLIEPLGEFAATVAAGFELAESRPDTLVTFGVVPDEPTTGFGYLEPGEPLSGAARVVTSFREKPSAGQAAAFVAAGFLWNSGMFVWRAATLLSAVATFAPAHAAAATAVASGTDGAAAQWQALDRLSIDYGVMEPAAAAPEFTVAAVPLACRWSDVGSWPAYGAALPADSSGNAVGAGEAVLLDSRRCVVAGSPGHLVALIGCSDLVVVTTPSATLVMPAAEAQRVKELHAEVARRFPDLA